MKTSIHPYIHIPIYPCIYTSIYPYIHTFINTHATHTLPVMPPHLSVDIDFHLRLRLLHRLLPVVDDGDHTLQILRGKQTQVGAQLPLLLHRHWPETGGGDGGWGLGEGGWE